MQALNKKIEQEFLQKSAIAPDVYRLSVELVPDIEVDPHSHDVSTPLHDLLGWKYTRFVHQVRPPQLGAAFIQETGEYWQVKIFEETENAGIRSGQYYAPNGIGDKAYLPPVPPEIVYEIAKQYDLTPPSFGVLFWDWFKEHKQIDLTITEGGKKALSGLSKGIPTIALFGCECGAKTKDAEGNVIPLSLTPELKELCEGRRVNIAFDEDENRKTRKKVTLAKRRLGAAIERAGGFPYLASWESKLGKGIDDLIANKGGDFFKQILLTAPTFRSWQRKEKNSILPFVDLLIDDNEKYLPSDLSLPPFAQLIGINAPKGSGKTEFLKKVVDEAKAPGIRTLVITHRIQLYKSLCDRFGLEHIGEINTSETAGIHGYGLCIDSLHPKSQAKFNPEDWQGAWIVFDECEQILWHLLNSDTCLYNRVSILENLGEVVRVVIESGGKIFLSDGDLSSLSVEFFEKLIGYPIQRWIIQKNQPEQKIKELYALSHPELLFKEILKGIGNNQKIIIHTSAQKAKSRWSTINLESQLKKSFPNLKILRIDAESIVEPLHPACGCIERLNDILPLYDIVIASPTIETGVSIDVKHFDGVYCFAQGVQTVDAVCQTLERVRDNVPRYIFAPKASSSRIGNGSTSVVSLLSSQDKTFRINFNFLGQADTIRALDDHDELYLKTWVKFAAHHNEGFVNYRESIIEKLLDEGYELVTISSQLTESEIDSELSLIRDLMKSNQNKNYQERCQKVSASDNPTDSELDKWRHEPPKTETERYQKTKGELCRKYETENITPEMVERDDQGWFSKLTLHYYLTMGKPFLHERDKKKAETLTENSNGKVFKPDFNKTQLTSRVEALIALDIEQFFDTTRVFDNDNLQPWFQRVIKYRGDIKDFLNQTINTEKDTAVGVAQRLLGMLGLKMTCIGQFRRNGKRVRVYQMLDMNPDDRDSIFTRWFARDSK